MRRSIVLMLRRVLRVGGLGQAFGETERQEQKQVRRLRRRMTTKIQRQMQGCSEASKCCSSWVGAEADEQRKSNRRSFDHDPRRTRVAAQDDRFFPERDLSFGLLGYEMDGAEDAGGDGLDLVEVLRLEAVAVLFYGGFVRVGGAGGPGCGGGVC